MDTVTTNIESFSAVELSIIQELTGSTTRFADLRRATGLSPRWLNISLKRLKERGAVRKVLDEKDHALGWDLQSDWRSKNRKLVNMLKLIRQIHAVWEAQTDYEFSRSGSLGQHESDDAISSEYMKAGWNLMGLFVRSVTFAFAMKYYREENLFELIRDQTLDRMRVTVQNGFKAVDSLTNSQLNSPFKGIGHALDAMSFQEFVEEMPSMLKRLQQHAEYWRQRAERGKS